MADSILRLRVESTEYDSKLKKASQGLQHYIDNCRKVGGTLAVVEDNTLAFVRALGDMPTVAQGGTQSLREMTKSLTDLTIQYRSLTDEEKNSPFGQAMAQSIQTLTERAGQARDAVDDVNATIKNAASDTRVFDQIAGAAGLATAGFQTFQGAAKLLGIEMNNNVEVIAKLQAAMAITNGLTQIQTALQKESAVMQGVAAVQAKALAAAQAMNAESTTAAAVAQKAFNAVAKANPYVLLGTAILGVVGTLAAFSRASKNAEESEEDLIKRIDDANKKAQEQANAFVNASADMMLTADRISKLQAAYVSAIGEMEKTSVLKEAQSEFSKLGIECNNLSDAQTLLMQKGGAVIEMIRTQGTVAALTALRIEEYKKSFSMLLTNGYDVESASILAGYNQNVQDLDNQITKAQQRIAGLQSGLPMKTGSDNPTVSDTPVSPAYPTGSVADLTQQLKDLKAAQSLVTSNDDWVKYQEQIKHVEYQINALKGEWQTGLQATFTVTTDDTEALAKIAEIQGATIADKTVMVHADTVEAYNEIIQLTRNIEGTTVTFSVKPEIDRNIGRSITNSAGLSELISGIKKQLQEADFGSDLYQSLTDKLADATMLQNLVKESLSVGLGTALFDIADETGQDFWDRVLSPEGVENADWQAIADVINQKRKELGLDAITLDFNTGNVSSGKANNEEIDISKQVVSGLSQVSSGLNQMGIQIPDGISKAIGAMQGLMSVIEGMKTITEILRSSSMASIIGSQATNTAAVAANTTAIKALTAAMATDTAMEGSEALMTAVKIAAVAAMAHGGIVPHAAHGYAVPGTHYSGDTTPILANAGELVLNRAQQGNLASQLEDSKSETPTSAKPYVTGQDIYLGLNNYLMGAGLGHIVTTKQ